VSRTALALALAFSIAPFAAAQSQPPAIRVETDLQPIDVQVKDAKGNNIRDLTANDFDVLENGKRQEVAFFDAGNGPVAVAILVDSSDSMYDNGRPGSAASLAAQFMATARTGDEVWGMDFSDQMGPFQQLSAEDLRNPSASTLAPAPSHGSALYDAIATALCHLHTSTNLRQAVIVITDGVDQYSRLNLEQLIGLVRSSRAQLFMIGLQSLPEFGFHGHAEPKLTLITGHDIDNPVVVFDDLMKESGAESFLLRSQSGLNEALKAVSDVLQSEYTLAYYPPPNTSDKPRKIQVKVDRHGAHVLAREFIDSEADASRFVHFDQLACTVSPEFHPYPYEARLTRGANGMTYREDFSDPHTGWPDHPDSHYVSGGYQLSNAPVINRGVEEAAQNVIAAYGPWWSDFRASVMLRILPAAQIADPERGPQWQFPDAAGPAAGLVFRMSSKGYYALLVSGTVNKSRISVELVRRDFLPGEQRDYSETKIVPWTVSGLLQPSGTTVSVESMGSQITIFADAHEIKTVQDPIYDEGFVGFIVSGPEQAIFKNLVVEQSKAPFRFAQARATSGPRGKTAAAIFRESAQSNFRVRRQ
jgi:VWFA-related protein